VSRNRDHSSASNQSFGPWPPPRVVAWEITRRCNLNCVHCRAGGAAGSAEGELSGEECVRFLGKLASFAPGSLLIVTGGEPLVRSDVFELLAAGTRLGLKIVIATCGELVTPDSVESMRAAGIRKMSLSIDGAKAATHDRLRGTKGAFDMVMSAARSAKSSNFPFQVNTVVSKANVQELPALLDLAVCLGADAFHPFLMVPTGRGASIADAELGPGEHDKVLTWLAERAGSAPVDIKPTCSPQYCRILRQRGAKRTRKGKRSMAASGCLGGRSFVFVGYDGEVRACGFLPVQCGHLRRTEFDLRPIWNSSPVFEALRSRSRLSGRCGVCEFREPCGGCRARAYAATGDYLAEDPVCRYEPQKAT